MRGREAIRMAGRWDIWLLLILSFVNLVELAKTFSLTNLM